MDMSNKKFHIIATLLTIVIMISVIWANVYMRSRKYFQEGEQYLSEGQLIEAVTSFETSAHAYTPGNKWVTQSLERMWEIGNRLEEEHDDPMYPLIAYRALRSSIYAVRSFYSPNKEWIPRCDQKIKGLVDEQIKQMEASKQ